MQSELDTRSRAILHHIVESYIETGEPVGSKTLSAQLDLSLSPATIRNIMADLAEAGFLYAPHTSAGRLPTEAGLKLFVEALLKVGSINPLEQKAIEEQCQANGRSLEEALEEATKLLSGLSHCAGLVSAPKTADTSFKHVEFVSISSNRALVVMVMENGVVENRVIEMPSEMPPSALTEASNYINTRLKGKTLEDVRNHIIEEIRHHKAQLDTLASHVVKEGIAALPSGRGSLIVRGKSNLLRDVTQLKDIEKIRMLLDDLETNESLVKLLEATSAAEGVQIFIGSCSRLFNTSGCSMIISPYSNARDQTIGVIGVIGPARMNYAKVIPIVDYTAKTISRLLGMSIV